MGFQEGMKSTDIVKDLKEKGSDLLVAEWIVWPPAQMINFLLLPTRYRVLYDNSVSLGFDYYYSYVMYRKGKGTTDTEEKDSEDNCEEKKDESDSW